jgi:hypothetical protein
VRVGKRETIRLERGTVVRVRANDVTVFSGQRGTIHVRGSSALALGNTAGASMCSADNCQLSRDKHELFFLIDWFASMNDANGLVEIAIEDPPGPPSSSVLAR